MKKENEIVQKLKEFLKEKLSEATVPRARRIFVRIKKGAAKETVNYLVKELGFKHLSTITGVDLGNEIELIYHLAYNGAIELSLRFSVPKKQPNTLTISNIIPGAVLYEREVHDLFGVTFEGHPDLSPLVLPEGWPKDVCPLRKEWKFEEIRKLTLKEGKRE